METLISGFASTIAELFWFFALKYQKYEFRQQDGRVIRVVISEVVVEEMESDVKYAEVVS